MLEEAEFALFAFVWVGAGEAVEGEALFSASPSRSLANKLSGAPSNKLLCHNPSVLATNFGSSSNRTSRERPSMSRAVDQCRMLMLVGVGECTVGSWGHNQVTDDIMIKGPLRGACPTEKARLRPPSRGSNKSRGRMQYRCYDCVIWRGISHMQRVPPKMPWESEKRWCVRHGEGKRV